MSSLPKDEIMKAGFDHPCRQTCSGWEQGQERGVFECESRAKELAERLEAVTICLEGRLSGSYQYVKQLDGSIKHEFIPDFATEHCEKARRALKNWNQGRDEG
jgi:hypothetical protein